MEDRLEGLARRILECRKRGHRLTLECILESGRILAEAKAIAKRQFGNWLQEKAHMTYETARRHLRVSRLVRENHSLTSKIATLGLAKIYALSTLDFATARKYLTGEARFSAPLEHLSDVQFRKEFRARFPLPEKRRTREHVFRSLVSALIRMEKALGQAGRFVHRLTPVQRRRIVEKIGLLEHDLPAGYGVA